jgi:hypothetical protein
MQRTKENPKPTGHDRGKGQKGKDVKDDVLADVKAQLESSLRDIVDDAKALVEAGRGLGSDEPSGLDRALGGILNEVLKVLQGSRLKANYQPSVHPDDIDFREMEAKEKQEIKENFLKKDWKHFLDLSQFADLWSYR